MNDLAATLSDYESSLSRSQILRLRLRCQRLLDQPAAPTSLEQVLDALCGVQTQDLLSGELSAGVRLPGLTLEQVEAARSQPRRILRIWSLRGTLHLHTARDAGWLVPFLGPRSIAADRRRMAQLGWDETRVTRATRLVLERVEDQGGITRPELARLLVEQRLPSAGQAPIHLLAHLVNRGCLCQGPDRVTPNHVRAGFEPAPTPSDTAHTEPTYLPFETWAGPLQPMPDEAALAELARRYLAAYAPAGPHDLAAWSGLKIGEARRAWDLLGAELVPIETDEEPLWLLKTQSDGLDDETFMDGIGQPVLRLLPRFDTYLLGWRDRHRILAPEQEPRLIPGGGILPATLLVDGCLTGVWSTARRRATRQSSNPPLLLTVQPLEPLPERLLPLLEQEAARMGHFLGLAVDLQIKP